MSSAEELFPSSLGDVLSTAVIARRLQTTRKTIQRLAENGDFPPPVRLGPRTLRWSRQAIVAHLARRSGGAEA